MKNKVMPFREAVVRIKEETTMGDLKRLSGVIDEMLGCQCLLVAIHRDEGK